MLQSVIDGDLCEYYNSLDSSKRRSIAEELDRTPAEVNFHFFFVELSLFSSLIYVACSLLKHQALPTVKLCFREQ